MLMILSCALRTRMMLSSVRDGAPELSGRRRLEFP
jgi:hypothetical protein